MAGMLPCHSRSDPVPVVLLESRKVLLSCSFVRKKVRRKYRAISWSNDALMDGDDFGWEGLEKSGSVVLRPVKADSSSGQALAKKADLE